MAEAYTIRLKGSKGRFEEAPANGAVSPGDLIETASDGDFQVHATEGGYTEKRFALEDATHPSGRDINDNYATGERVFSYVAQPGDHIQAWLKAGENVVKGQRLISAGDGTLKEEDNIASGSTVKEVVAIAMEALNLSASGAVDTRLNVQVV